MRPPCAILAVSILAALPGRGSQGDPPSIVRIELPSEEAETRPFTLPTAPEDTLEIDFPWPLEDWAGRGFTPDPEKFAGDFVVEATRGKSRAFITPVVEQAHRVLHVVLAGPEGRTRSVTLEMIPAPPGLAWHKVAFAMPAPSPSAHGTVSLRERPPRSAMRAASPESEIGMIRTLRLLMNSSAADATSIAAANPSLDLAVLDERPRSFGDFTLTPRYAVRDATTDSLGLCVSVSNATARRLLFDPEAWAVRAGDRVYPVRTVDFPGELEPGASSAAFLVLTRGLDGMPLSLLPDNSFEVSAVLAGSANPRPVSRYAIEGMDP